MLGKSNNLTDLLKRAKSVSTVITESLEEIRSQIEDLKSRQDEISELPVAEDVAVSRAVAWMQARIVAAQQHVGSPARFSVSPDRWKNGWESTVDFGALTLAYLGDQLLDAVSSEIKQLYAGRPGITDKERQKLLDDNDRQILDAELMEEAIIRQAEQQGYTIERRVDADPRAVLAHESALP